MTDPIIAEAYARARPRDMLLDTLEISHPGLAAVIRVAAQATADIDLPPSLGEPDVTFQALPFRVQLPGDALKEAGDDGSVVIDSVHPLIRAAARDLASTGHPAEVVYRQYELGFSAGAPVLPAAPCYVLTGLICKSIALSAATASASIGPRDRTNINVPRFVFSQALYPALHGV